MAQWDKLHAVEEGICAMTDTDPKREAAIKRLKAKRGFWDHVAVYTIVNILLVIVWAFSGRGYFWPIWIIAGWGIGLLMNA